MRPKKSNTETVWSGESEANVHEVPESCSLTKLSRRDSKGFNSQNCEMRSKSIAGGDNAGKDDLDDGAGDQDIKFGVRVMRHTR